jgi:hypothetical protein
MPKKPNIEPLPEPVRLAFAERQRARARYESDKDWFQACDVATRDKDWDWLYCEIRNAAMLLTDVRKLYEAAGESNQAPDLSKFALSNMELMLASIAEDAAAIVYASKSREARREAEAEDDGDTED